MLPMLMSLIMAGLPLPFAELVAPPTPKEWTQEEVKSLAIENLEVILFFSNQCNIFFFHPYTLSSHPNKVPVQDSFL